MYTHLAPSVELSPVGSDREEKSKSAPITTSPPISQTITTIQRAALKPVSPHRELHQQPNSKET